MERRDTKHGMHWEAIKVTSRAWPQFALMACSSHWGGKSHLPCWSAAAAELKGRGWDSAGRGSTVGFSELASPSAWPSRVSPIQPRPSGQNWHIHWKASSGGSWQLSTPRQPIRNNIRQSPNCIITVPDMPTLRGGLGTEKEVSAAIRSLLLDAANRERCSKYLGSMGHAVLSPAQQLGVRQERNLVAYAMFCRVGFGSFNATFLVLKGFLQLLQN